MRNSDSSDGYEANLAVYAELQPIERHGSLVDHLFILRDRGRLTGTGRSLFASPFSEIVLIGQCRDDDGEHTGGSIAWKAFHLPPRFGRQPRQRSFHGWMVGIRCRPLDPRAADAALAGLSERFTTTFDGASERSFDPIVASLDALIEHLGPRFSAAAIPPPRTPEIAADLTASGLDHATPVASMAATAGVAPRTLQRHVRKRTGLAPKRYAAVARFSGALRQIAHERKSLAHIASEAGYSDQAHLTMEMGRHAGLSPGRFREQARRNIVPDAVRFFKDADLRNRVRVLVCDSSHANDEATGGEIRSEGCKLRGPGQSELRAPNRDGDAGH